MVVNRTPYDPLGNRLTSTGTTNPWTYSSNNELLSYDDVSFVYDSNGNTVQKTDGSGATKYIHDMENQLVRVETGSGTIIASYHYDPFGRRLWKEVGGTRTFFNYSEEGLIGEYANDGSPIRTYSYRPGSTWTSDPLFMKEGEKYYYFQNDHLGTPVMMTNLSGASVWAASYSSFGEAAVDASSTVVNNLRFPGQYFDAETGMHYNYHRYYDPETGRYITADPIGFKGGINFFSYVGNNTLKRIDPYGLWCGSGISEWLVPDQPEGYDFSMCCKGHDDCYDGKDGQCSKEQKDCDKDFHKCLQEVCSKENDNAYKAFVPDPERPEKFLGRSRTRCEELAETYWKAVEKWGYKAFGPARAQPTCPCNP